MEIEGLYEAVAIVYISKLLRETGKHQLVEQCGINDLHYDYYYDYLVELNDKIFDQVRYQQNEERGLALSVYSGHEMEDYFILAGQYGRLKGIPESENPYFKAAMDAADEYFTFSYSLDWNLQMHSEPKRPFQSRLGIIEYYEEFDCQDSLVIGLIRFRAFLEKGCAELRGIHDGEEAA